MERDIFPYPVDFEMGNLAPEQTNPIRLTGDGVDISSNGIGMWTTAPLNRGDVVKLYIPVAVPEHHSSLLVRGSLGRTRQQS